MSVFQAGFPVPSAVGTSCHQHLAEPFLLWSLSVGGWKLLPDGNWHFPEDSRCWPAVSLAFGHSSLSSVTCLLKSSVHFCSWAVCLSPRVLEEFFTYSGYNPLSEICLVEYFLLVSDFFFHFPHSIVGWAEALIQMESNFIHLKIFYAEWRAPRNIYLPQDKRRLSPCVSSRSFFVF